jgi:hypothetical protein
VGRCHLQLHTHCIYRATSGGWSAAAGKFEGEPSFTPTDAGGKLLDVRFEVSDLLWPWSGHLALYLRVKAGGAKYEGTASGQVCICGCGTTDAGPLQMTPGHSRGERADSGAVSDSTRGLHPAVCANAAVCPMQVTFTIVSPPARGERLPRKSTVTMPLTVAIMPTPPRRAC